MIQKPVFMIGFMKNGRHARTLKGELMCLHDADTIIVIDIKYNSGERVFSFNNNAEYSFLPHV